MSDGFMEAKLALSSTITGMKLAMHAGTIV
jgi:hypothetical protein